MNKNLYKLDNIPFLVFISGQACTLKCKYCGNFSPYFSLGGGGDNNKYSFYDHKKICNDIKRITKRISISKIQIQGGEFFLHKNAKEILVDINKNEKISEIVISTNGTIIPNKDILSLLSNNKKITIRISNYKCIGKEKIDALKEILTLHNINYWIFNFFGNDSKWIKFQGLSAYRLNESDVESYYKNCPFKNCLTLENGYISRCSRAVIAHHAQKFSIKGYGVNIRKIGGIKALKAFIMNDSPVSACFYCHEQNSELIDAAEQMTQEEISLIKAII